MGSLELKFNFRKCFPISTSMPPGSKGSTRRNAVTFLLRSRASTRLSQEHLIQRCSTLQSLHSENHHRNVSTMFRMLLMLLMFLTLSPSKPTIVIRSQTTTRKLPESLHSPHSLSATMLHLRDSQSRLGP